MEPGAVVMKQPMGPGSVVYTDEVGLNPMPLPMTTVVTSQPTTTTTTIITQTNVLRPRGIPRDWSTPLCGCFEDCIGCLCAFFCFACYECHVSNKMGEPCCMPCCVPNATMLMRAHVRGRHNIQGSLINDCCTAVWCAHCTLTQLSREVDNILEGRAAP